MNDSIIKSICNELGIKEYQVTNVLEMLSEGNTIPFIARYRKERTGSLNEEQIRTINEYYEYQVNLLKRKEDVIRLIDEKGLLTDELKDKIMSCLKLVEVEDLYRPYKEKKKTKATEAINNGLEPLAKIIMSFPNTDVKEIAKKYVNDKVPIVEKAIEGASYIIAEYISDDAYYRKWIRNFIYKTGFIKTTKKKNAEDEFKTYEMYYDFNEKVSYLKPHRVLAINRAEKENVVSVSIDIETEKVLSFLEEKIVKGRTGSSYEIVVEAIKDSYKRLIFPSVEREVRSDLTEKAEISAVEVFKMNLTGLLLTPPMKEKVVLGFDPAFRTGCKLAVLDKIGNVIEISKIYPHEPQNEVEKSKAIMKALIQKHNVDIIAIGNGTASRESEKFVSELIKEIDKKVEYIIVSEAGASVYSASKLAISEFPSLDVSERSAISIGRRLQDPLSELVKIDTKSIGVGEYQHDINQKLLNESLDFVVSTSVNQVGVNINSASRSLLGYVSGMNKKSIDAIMDYKENVGKINSRADYKKIKGISDKIFEQSAGFMRIVDGNEPLDKTPIHPESYDVTKKLLKSLSLDESLLGTKELIEKLDKVNIENLSKELNIDTYTLTDIVEALKSPLRDPRDNMPKPLLRSDILTLEDLRVGMKLEGTVRNIVDFGVFIDIGLKNDGLAHISKLTDKFIKHPSEVVSVGQIVTVYVDEIFIDKKKVSLSLIEPNKN